MAVDFSLMIWSPLTVRRCRLSVVAVVEVSLHFSCPNMSDRLLYQSEAEQLVALSSWYQRFRFSVLLGALESRVIGPFKKFLTRRKPILPSYVAIKALFLEFF